MTAVLFQFQTQKSSACRAFNHEDLGEIYKTYDVMVTRRVASDIHIAEDDEGYSYASFYGSSDDPFLNICKRPDGFELRNTLWELTFKGADLGDLLARSIGTVVDRETGT
jgi:hypothetical protein